jgi:methionine synthase II (cobalamin-independent)
MTPASSTLPILPTTVVGSFAHPSWFYAAKKLKVRSELA